jgi:tRNA(fMet)-specific endonuclease VapC
MRYLLDTNACIGYINGRAPGVRQRLESLPPDDVAVCSVVKAELFYGAMKSNNPPETLAKQHVFLTILSIPIPRSIHRLNLTLQHPLEKVLRLFNDDRI